MPLDDSDFLERPALRVSFGPVLKPGDRLAGRFEIVALLGRGGMGEVYEAIDVELGVRVALKTIRSDRAFDEEMVVRFRKEVLRARSVAHPNVCRVYDLFSHPTADGQVVRFLTMELLQGQTLAARVHEIGALAIPEALAIATQLAGALDAAHQHGIVHRDLKPGNVVLVESGESLRAVVTDFGLAHLISDEGDSQESLLSGPLGGTEEYLAPELTSGRAIGRSADLYSFGVVLKEILTGNAAGGLSGEWPKPWIRAISACCDPDPRRRPRSASAAIEMIVGKPERSAIRRSVAAYLGVAVVAVALYGTFSRFLYWSPRIANGGHVVVADVGNATGEPELAALTEVLRRQLEQSPRLSVLEPASVAEVLRQMVKPADTPLSLEVAREVAWRAGADGVVSGRIWRAGAAYGLSVRLERRGARPDESGVNWSRAYEARDRSELRTAIRDAANWVRTAGGEAPADISRNDRAVEDVTTDSWRALELFSKAETLAASSREEDALAFLSEAVRLDPDFALAWMRLGDIRTSRRQFDEGYRDWIKALSVSGRRKLSPREEYRLRGMYASDTEDHAEAERVYRLYLLTYPNDPDPYFYIARPLLMLGRIEDATNMLSRAQQREPSRYRALAQLAMFNIRVGRLDAASTYIGELRARHQAAWANCIEGAQLFLAGQYRSALDRFERLERVDDQFLRSRATALQAAVLADTSRREEAEARLRRGAAADAERGDAAAQADKLLALAHLFVGRRDAPGARSLCLQAEQLDKAPVRLIREASLLARAGFVDDARRVLAALDVDSPARNVQVGRHRVLGEILLAKGNVRNAWSEFQAAGVMEAPGVFREYLARGAAAAGEYGVALAMYQQMAEAPGYFWRYPDNDPPGSWSESIVRFVDLAEHHAAQAAPTDLAAAKQQLSALRAGQLTH